MQFVLDFCLLVLPTTVVTWCGLHLRILRRDGARRRVFRGDTAARKSLWHLGLYTFSTTWVTIVLISVLGLRLSCASRRPRPGCIPREASGALSSCTG